MADCVFCKIIKRDAPASIVYEDADHLAFMDIRPVTPGHMLVIPKRHAISLADMSGEECGRMFSATHRLAAALRASGLRCEAVNLHLADGEAAGQEVFHIHVHIFPRFTGDGFGMRFGPEYRHPPQRGVLDEHAERVRSAMESPKTDM